MKKEYSAPVARAIKFKYEKVVAASRCDEQTVWGQANIEGRDCFDLRKDVPARSADPCKVLTLT